MKFSLYAIYDSVAATYAPPFIQTNDRLAERSFRDLVNDPASRVNKNPGDYSLVTLGTFDDETGELEKLPTVRLFIGSQFIKA